MVSLVEKRLKYLEQLCLDFKVNRLDLFGSAANSNNESKIGDLDFIATFKDKTPGKYADQYLAFAEALESLFQCKVDLLTERSIRNPFFRQSVNSSRINLYEDRSQKKTD
jgi:hypothetical protein